MDKKISVIVPIYNVEPYLNRCVQSLTQQTYSNLEIILVDDGSPDNCPAICDEWAKKDERIKAIHQKNGGVSRARNSGLDAASGEYVIFVDPDDYVKNTIVEELFNLCQKHNADISVCNYVRFSGESVTNEEIKTQEAENETLEEYKPLEVMKLIHGWEGELYNVVWCKLYKMSLWEDVRYPEGKINEDEFTVYKILYKADKIVKTNKIYYYYYYNSNSITTNEKYIGTFDIFEALDERKAMYLNNGHTELAAIVEKAKLDRIIMRYRKAHKVKNKEVLGIMKKYYKEQYKILSVMKPGIGYKIFYFSPSIYELLLSIKER